MSDIYELTLDDLNMTDGSDEEIESKSSSTTQLEAPAATASSHHLALPAASNLQYDDGEHVPSEAIDLYVAPAGTTDNVLSINDALSIDDILLLVTRSITPATAQCVSCSDEFPLNELVKASCEHFYCHKCFEDFVTASLKPHGIFLASCCKIALAFNTIADNMSAALFQHYRKRQDNIKNTNSVHCAVPECGIRIPPEGIIENKNEATCRMCKRTTYTLCLTAHPK